MKRAAFVLGLAGLIPFIGLGIVAMTSNTYASAAAGLQKDYAAAVLAFLGAMHWGAAFVGKMQARHATVALTWGVMPALMAWAVTGLPMTQALAWLALGIALCFAVDWSMLRWHAWPVWYLPLRLALTVGAILGISLTLRGIS
jgi:Protein of unknown function (DUF3429)